MSAKPILLSVLAGSLFFIPIARAQEPGAAAQLPPGDAKELVEGACSACHSLTNITNSQGHTPEEWRTTLAMMLNVGAAIPSDKVDTVRDYLAKNFPAKPGPPPAVIPGDVEVSFKEWQLPTPGTRPHDPLAAPDGTIWYTGHMANLLGHIDPKTGEIKEYRTSQAMSGPHGLVMDKDGNIWFTANFKAYIGKFEPATGKFTKYPLDPKARDPHTPIFDQKGTLWFSVQGANMVGRLNPETGKSEVVTSPTPKSNPYGMVMTSKGIPYFVEFGAPKIAWIDPDTLDIHEINLPHEESRPRRVAITPDDVIYYSEYSRGDLGRYDIKTGKMTEWPSPSGPKSQPYGITIVNGMVWYSESNSKPNTIVRFDPKTEKFQTWAIPSGGGVVRNMVHTPDGNLWIACSGMNRIGEVIVNKGGTKVSQKN